MAETDENAGAGAADDEAQMRAEEESAKAMEAEVPHPAGYDDEAQEPPSDLREGESA
ncbi:MAG: hypothetical protein ABW250_03040 [Pyrinomonadaceae bacterium]